MILSISSSVTDDSDLEDDDSVTEDNIQFCLMELERELLGDEPDGPVEEPERMKKSSRRRGHVVPHTSPMQMTLDVNVEISLNTPARPSRTDETDERESGKVAVRLLLRFKKTKLNKTLNPAEHWYSHIRKCAK